MYKFHLTNTKLILIPGFKSACFSNTMVASGSFVFPGNVNLVFPSLLMQEGNFSFVF